MRRLAHRFTRRQIEINATKKRYASADCGGKIARRCGFTDYFAQDLPRLLFH